MPARPTKGRSAVPESGFYVFARIENDDDPIAHLRSEEWANQVAQLTGRDERLDPSPHCHVVPSGPDADWLLWDVELRESEKTIQWVELDWYERSGADCDLRLHDMLSPATRPTIELSPMLRAKVVADILIEGLPDERAHTPANSVTSVTIDNWPEGGKVFAEELKAVSAIPTGTAPKPDGWTRAELIAQARHDSAACSETTFDTIRKAAEIPPAEKGGAGAQRRFSVAQLGRLIAAAEAGKFRGREKIATAWRELLPNS